MSNPFDQFDGKPSRSGANPFDEFDTEQPVKSEPVSRAPLLSAGAMPGTGVLPALLSQPLPQKARAPRGGKPMAPVGSQRNPFPNRAPLGAGGRPVPVPDGAFYYGKGGKVERREVGMLEALAGVLERGSLNLLESAEKIPSVLSANSADDAIAQSDAFGGQWVGDVFIPATPESRQEAVATLGRSLANQGQIANRYDLIRPETAKTEARLELERNLQADQSFFGTLGALWDDKANAAGLLSESLGPSVPALAVSALMRNPYALMAVNGASGFQQEMSAGMAEYLDAQQIPRDQWGSLPEDVMMQAVEHARNRAAVVGGAGVLSGKLASTRLISPTMTASPAKAVVGNVAGQSLLGAAIDGLGEDLAQRAGNLPYSGQNTAMELAAGGLSQPVEATQTTLEAAQLAGKSWTDVATDADLLAVSTAPNVGRERQLEAALALMNRGQSITPEGTLGGIPTPVRPQIQADPEIPDEELAATLGQIVEQNAEQQAKEQAAAPILQAVAEAVSQPATDNPQAGDAFDQRAEALKSQIADAISRAQPSTAAPEEQGLGDIVGVPADDQWDILRQFFDQPELGRQAGTEADLSPATATPPVGQTNDRRQDPMRRKAIAEMSPDELRSELMTSPVTGGRNRRAYQDAPKKAVQVALDADNLKWVNDNMGHQNGDSMIAAIHEALSAETDEAYHISGDEFVVQADSQDQADAIMARVQDRLSRATITATLPDGRVLTKTGIGVSYGAGQNLEAAESALGSSKAQRASEGRRFNREVGGTPEGVAVAAAEGNQSQGDAAPAVAPARDTMPLYGTGIDRGEQAEETNDSRVLETALQRWAGIRADAGNPERDSRGNAIGVSDIRIREVPRRALYDPLATAVGIAERILIGPGLRVAVITDEGSPKPLWFEGAFLNNTLYVNATAKQPVVTIVSHEFIHSLKESDPDLYQRLADYVAEYGDEAGHSKRFGYNKEPGYDAAKGVEELTANLTAEAMTDPAFLSKMAEREPSLFRDLAEVFIEYLDGIMAVFGRNRAPNVSQHIKDIEGFRDLLADILVEKAQRNERKGDVLAMEREIGWEQTGGQLVGRSGMDAGVNGEGGGFQVSGRTEWIPLPRADGRGRSNFWSMRPGDNPGEGAKISERGARLALRKYANGEKLTAQERRFVEYAERAAAEYRNEGQGDVAQEPADPNNWLGADRVFTEQAENDFGPIGPIREAIDFAKSAEAGTTTLEIKTRPNGKEWNVLYVSNGDGTVESVSIGSERNGSLPELVEGAKKRAKSFKKMVDDRQAKVEAEAINERAIAKANGFAVGRKLGKIALNSGKKASAAVITEDNGDGKFTVEMTMGNQRGVVRDWPASAIVQAIQRVNPDYVAPNDDIQSDIPFQRTEASTPLNGSTEVEVDGVMRPALNSEGRPIHDTVEAVQNFWRWFGDSKVVDEQGRPMVVYHGTPEDFDTFNPDAVASNSDEKAAGLFFFAEDSRTASSYADHSEGRVIPAYIKAESPQDARSIPSPRRSRELAIEWMEEDGNDSAVFNDSNQSGQFGGIAWVVRSPNQIKSAIGNNGDFNPARPEIQFSRQEGDIDLTNATGRSIMADGRLLSLLDAAKRAGIDMEALRQAYADRNFDAAADAIDGILAQMRPEPMRSTGLKNAVTDAEREAANKDPILREAVKGNEATLYEAMRTLKGDPLAGPEAISRLNRAGAEGISLADEAVLLVYKTELMNKRDAAAKKLSDANANEDAKEAARKVWEESEAAITAIDLASVNAGREWGRFGQFRQRMLKADFTFEAMERKERARLERPLNAEESARIKEMADKIAALQARVDELQRRKKNASSEGAYEALEKALRRPRKERKSLEYLKKAANDARARISAVQSVPSRRGQSGAVLSPAVLYDYAIVGAYHIANGAANFADWVGAMRADIGEKFDQFRDRHQEIFGQSKRLSEATAGATVDEVMAEIDLANIKPKDVRKLIEAFVGDGLRGEPAVIGAAAEKLELSEDNVRALFIQTEPRGPQTLSEAQEELRDLKKIVRIEAEIDRLEAGKPKPARGEPAVDSPEVAAKKKELAELRKRLRPVVDQEQRYQELRGKQIQKRIEDLQARIARGDFAARPRIPRALNEANQQAMFELDKAKEEFLRYQYLEQLKARSKWGKALGFVGDAFNMSRAVMTSLDLSGLLRQGGFVTLGHPIMGTRAFFKTLPALFSEQAEHRVMNDIKSRPNAPLYLKYKLALTGIGGGPLTKIEEAYAARWLDRVEAVQGETVKNAIRRVRNLATAPVRGSGRVYAALLNLLRADAFDALAATMTKTGTPTEAEAKHIVDFVNTATGRAKIWGRSDNPGEIINTLAFAPRLVVSRISLATMTPIWTAPSGRMQKLIALEYARFLTGVAIASSLLAYGLGDDDDEQEYADRFTFDPRSSDFMKLRFGNTRLDPFTGISQVTVMMSRLLTGETVNAKGEVKPIRPKWTMTDFRRILGEDIPAHEGVSEEGKLNFGERTSMDVIASFLRSKLAPIPGAAVNIIAGSDFKGDPITLADQAKALALPMTFGDIAKAMEENGVPRGTAMSMLALLGMSMQVQTPSNRQQFAQFTDEVDAVRADVKDRLRQVPIEDWPVKMDEMKAEYGPMLEGVELDFYKQDGKYGLSGEPKRDKDGNPVLKSNRLSEREKYDDGLPGTQVHHIIPDNLVRRHPLMAAARKAGYDLDHDGNLISMPDAAKDGEVAHTTDHPNYDAEVYGALQEATKRLRKEHGSLEEVPADALLEEVRKVEDAMRERLMKKDVPTKDGRLARVGGVSQMGA